ncbi:hypothetical protein Tco_0001153 [Tanacetum coccineum]
MATPYLPRGLATPYLLRGPAAPYLMRGLATPYLMRRLAAPYLLRGLATPYLLRRHYSLVIASGPEVAFVTPTILDTELETLIATYDIPLDLRPRLPDPNFRMINLPARDTAIGIYARIFYSSGVRIPFSSFLLAVLKYFKVHISQLVPLGLSKGDWFFFAKRGDPATVCMEVAKSGLKLWKEKFFLIDQWVLVRSGLSRVWRNPMCDPVLRRSDNTVMSIYDFLCMPSLDKVTVREEPHGLDTSILGRVADRTTSPTPVGTAIPRASLEEIVVTHPNRKVVTKAGHAAKRKASTGPEISTNVAKKTKSNKKGSRAGSSGQAAGDEVEQTDDGTLDDDDHRDGSEFAMEGIENLNDVSQGDHINVIPLRTFDSSIGLDVTYPPILLADKEVEAHAYLGRVSEDASPPAQEAVLAPDTQPLDADAGADEIASDGNVDPYYEARVGNTAGDVLERDLLPFVSGPYYIPYPYDEGSGSESSPYNKDDWEEIHGVNLGLRKKELYKDPKVCRTALDRFPTPAETHRLRELSSVELSDCMSMLQCQLITHGSMLNARYDHFLRNVERLSKQCAQQTQTIKRQQSVDLKQQNESTVHANEEVSRLTTKLGVLKSRCQTAKHKLSSWDKKHRKYRNKRDTLAMEKEKIEEELVGTKSQLEHRERQAEEIQGSIASFFHVGVERGLRMDCTDEEFRELSQRVVGFISDAKEVSQNSQSSLQDIARLEPNRVTSSHQTSSAIVSLRANTHVRHSTSSSRTSGRIPFSR